MLFDCGVVSTREPFRRLVSQGMILGETEFTAGRTADGRTVSAEGMAGGVAGSQAVKLEAAEVEKRGDGWVLRSDPAVRVAARSFKMSKSRGNVVNPDDVARTRPSLCYAAPPPRSRRRLRRRSVPPQVASHGADSLRLYEMFMGPLRETKARPARAARAARGLRPPFSQERSAPAAAGAALPQTWSTRNVDGVSRFLGRAWRLFGAHAAWRDEPPTAEQLAVLHATIRKVTDDTEGLRFNTGISAMMEFVNAAGKWDRVGRQVPPHTLWRHGRAAARCATCAGV